MMETAVTRDSTWKANLPQSAVHPLTDDDILSLEALDEGGNEPSVPLILKNRILDEIRHGSGVIVLRGVPVMEWGKEKSSRIYENLGRRLGELREQSPAGNLLHDVTDTTVLGVSAEAAGGSNSRKRISLHTENARPPKPPRILSLLSIRSAESGGESILLSGHSIYNHILETRPDLLRRAYEPFIFGRHDYDIDEIGVDEVPVFRENENGIAFRYSRYWLDVGARWVGHEFAEEELDLMNMIDNVLEDSAFYAKLLLQPGDAIFINNEVVMHGREAFTDAPRVEDRRCLIRLWVDYV